MRETNLSKFVDENESLEYVGKVKRSPVLVEGFIVESVVDREEVVFRYRRVVICIYWATQGRIILSTVDGRVELLLIWRDTCECGEE